MKTILAVFTIVRPNTDEFEWDFGASLEEKNSEKGKYPIIDIVPLKDYGKIFDPEKNIENIYQDNLLIRNCKILLSGHEVYNLKRTIHIYQDLKTDREWVFGSDRIMDHLDVHIKYSKDLSVIFSSSNNTRFIPENFPESNRMSYISQELMLPGEKFKLFFLKV